MADEAHEREGEERPPPDTPETPEQGAPRRGRGPLDPILSVERGLASASAEDDAPAASARAGDRWPHRRGEPRVLALFWSIYLFGAAISTVMRIPVLGMTELRFVQSASRMLLLLIAVGLVALWPMVRLSQAPPKRPVIAALLDILLLNATLQAVVWPLTWLGKWTVPVTAGVVLMLLSWSALVGAMVACGTARRVGPGRTVWMLLCAVAVVAAPALALALGAAGAPVADELALASPLTGVYAITTAPSGLSPSMDATSWTSAWAPGALSIPLWLLAAAIARASRRRRAG